MQSTQKTHGAYSPASRNFWPGQNFWPQSKISAWNSGLEKTSRKFQSRISSQNSRPIFLFFCLPNANLGIKVLLLCSCDLSFKFDLKIWKIQTSHAILAWNFLAWNSGLKKSRRKISAWKAISARTWIGPKGPFINYVCTKQTRMVSDLVTWAAGANYWLNWHVPPDFSQKLRFS